MEADIARKTFHKDKHFKKVTGQQGRTQLEADSNEEADILNYRSSISSRDIIGKTGAPKDDAGFKIKLSATLNNPESSGCNYVVEKGRYYIDGDLCENESDVDAANQPDLPLLLLCAWHDISSNDSKIRNYAIGRILDFLRTFIPSFKNSSWKKSNEVTVETRKDDNEKILRRPDSPDEFISLTLDNNDSAQATRAIVRFDTSHEEILELVIVKDSYEDDKIKLGYSPAIAFSNGKYILYLDEWEREITWLDDPNILEVALGGVDTATRTKTVWQVKLLPVGVDSDSEDRDERNKEFQKQQRQLQQEQQKQESHKEEKERRAHGSSNSQLGYCYCGSQFREWDELISEHKGTLQARLKPASSAIDDHGPRHRLYRVEIHEGGTLNNGATFKWSRDNGIVASKIAAITVNENKIIVENIGRDNSRFGYPIGSWIEITDDRHELWGIPGTLVEVADVKDNVIFFRPDTIKGESITIDNYPKIHNPKVRRWDSIGAIGVRVPTENEGYIDLEHDVQIRFGESNANSDGDSSSTAFRTGDYWLIPARRTETSRGIEFPIDEDGNPSALLAEGIKHHFSKLALLSIASSEKRNGDEDVKEIEEQQKSIEQQKQQKEQKFQREGEATSGGTHKYIAKIDDCRQFFLPLNSFTLRYVSGDGQESLADSILPTEVMARVTSGDIPVKGVMVKFMVERGEGSLRKVGSINKGHEYCIVSDDAGFVSCQWVLGNAGNQRVKATIVDMDCVNVPVDLPVYFNANISKETNETAKSGELTIDLRDATNHEGGVYRNIKHHIRKAGKNRPPPNVEIGLVSLISIDETSNVATESATGVTGSAGKKVQFIRENSIPELPKRLLRLRAVNIGSETFDLSLDENTTKELSNKASHMKLRWWAIPCEEQEPQFL